MKDTLTYDYVQIEVGEVELKEVETLEELISKLIELKERSATDFSIDYDEDDGTTISGHFTRPMTEEEKTKRDKDYEDYLKRRKEEPLVLIKSLFEQHSK